MSLSRSDEQAELKSIIETGRGETLLFGLTPPRASAGPERVAEMAQRTLTRLASVDVDGLILYDLDDESDRTDEPRPFPFSPTMDPTTFARDWLPDWAGPTVIYRAVGKYAESELTAWLHEQPPAAMVVFVGASSVDKRVHTSLRRAQHLCRELRPDILLGAVTIPERHAARGSEHEKLRAKQAAGCSFFVSQVVYQVETAKDLVSDYAYSCRRDGVAPAPIIFTLSLCGSVKTLEFLRWLGVDVPRWVSNELVHEQDPLQFSLERCERVAQDLTGFCRYLQVPFGFNVESVSTRRVEIEATVELTRRVGAVLGRTPDRSDEFAAQDQRPTG